MEKAGDKIKGYHNNSLKIETDISQVDIPTDRTYRLVLASSGSFGYPSNIWFDDVDLKSNQSTTENSKPTAQFTYSPESPETSQKVTFDASESTDSDGSIVKYEWDLKGDQAFERTGETIEYAFNKPGEHTVTLRTTDDSGDTATTSQALSVPLLRSTRKKEIAKNVDKFSITSLNDKARAETTIKDLSTAVQDGGLNIQNAEDTVERMLAGEQVTESVLENVGPSDDGIGQNYDLTKQLAEPVLTTALELYTGVRGATSSTLKQSDSSFLSLGSAGSFLFDGAKNLLSDSVSRLLDWFFGTFQEGKTDAKKSIIREGDDIVDQLEGNAEVTREKINALVDEAVGRILEAVAASLRAYFEQGITTPVPGIPLPDVGINTSLDYLHEGLNPDTAASGLPGTTQNAQLAKNRKIDEIDSQTTSVIENINNIKEFEKEAELIDAIADLFDQGKIRPIDAFQVLVGAANTLVGSITSAFSVGMGLQGLVELQVQHAIAVFLIVNGRETL